MGGTPPDNTNDIVTFKPNQLPINNDIGSSSIKQQQDILKGIPLVHDPTKPSLIGNSVAKPNEPSSTSLMNALTENKLLSGSLDPGKVDSNDPLTHLNAEKPENHLVNSLNPLKPLTANGPLDGDKLDRLNPISSKDPNGLTEPLHRLKGLSEPLDRLDPMGSKGLNGLTEPLDRLNPLSSKDPNGLPAETTSQLITSQLPNEPLKQSLDSMNPLNPIHPLTTMAGNSLKPVISLNQLNTPLLKPISKVPEHLNFDLMSPHEQLAATGHFDGGRRPLLLANSLGAPIKPLIPGNPGPGIHNNIGGMAGVDGIGPNGLPVIPGVDINTNFMTTSTLFPLMTTPITMTTPVQQRHVVMPEDSSCKCAQKTSSCTCKDNVQQQTTSSSTTMKPSQIQEEAIISSKVNDVCSYASKWKLELYLLRKKAYRNQVSRI